MRVNVQVERFDIWGKLFSGETVTAVEWHGKIAELNTAAGMLDTKDSPHQEVAATIGLGIADAFAILLFGAMGAFSAFGWRMKTRLAERLRSTDPSAPIPERYVRSLAEEMQQHQEGESVVDQR